MEKVERWLHCFQRLRSFAGGDKEAEGRMEAVGRARGCL